MKRLLRYAFLLLEILALYVSDTDHKSAPVVNKNTTLMAASNEIEQSSQAVFTSGNISIVYDLSSGTADFLSQGRTMIKGFYSAVKLPQDVTSRDYSQRTVIENGHEFTVVSSGGGYPSMHQKFNLVNTDYFIMTVELEGQALKSNWMAPLVAEGTGSIDFGSYKDITALWIPFDNDRDVKYDASTINRQDTSYEAAAFYDNVSRNGLVIGSVTHDTWKTGIDYKGENNKLSLLKVYGGAAINSPSHTLMRRDVQQHGYISGDTISSPGIFVGFFDDWRNGMENYADANTGVVPALQWDGGVVFGWNSWGAFGSRLDTEKVLASAGFIKKNLMDQGFINNNTAYVNLDSYWDSPAVDLKRFVDEVHKNGQKAGIYWSPFVDWAKAPNRKVEGTSYTYKDVWLKDDNGNPITYGDGPYALDPTHPGTLQRIDYTIDFFKEKGFDEYIKLDFLTHAALEGQHYDKAVTTGMQGMHKGMQYLLNRIKDRMGEDTFISQAISPLFPYQYAHSRRISCDKFGFLYESRDVLNSLAYGWWMSGRIYAFNDPDHIVLYNTWWNKGDKITENEAKARVTSAVISGTVLLSGDDLTNPAARERALKYLTNPAVNAIARLGKVFRPVEGNTGSAAPDAFSLDNGEGEYYIAVFNWDKTKDAIKTVDLQRAGLDPKKKFTAVEQWSNAASYVSGKLTATLGPGEAKIFRIR